MGADDGGARRRALALGTVSRSLSLQSPRMWEVLAVEGFDLTFAAARDTWTDGLLEQGGNARFTDLPTRRSLNPGTLLTTWRALRALAREDWDFVQVQTPIVAALWRGTAPKRLRRRTLYVAHGFHFQPGDRGVKPLVFRVVEGLLAHRVLGVATVNEADAVFVTGLPERLRPRISWQLPGAGVDTTAFAAVAEAARADRSPDATPSALFVGDLNANKNPLFCVDVVREVRRAGVPMGLTIIGEGPLAGRVHALAESLDWLTYIRVTHDIATHLSAAHVLLAPSAREGLPRVIIESLACGVPVVARSNRGSRQLLATGGGVLHDDLAAASWAGSVRELLTDPPDPAALVHIASAYDVEAFTDSYTALVQACLAVADRADHGQSG